MHRFRSYRYRKAFPAVTPQQFDDLRDEDVDWDMAFNDLDNRLEAEAMKSNG